MEGDKPPFPMLFPPGVEYAMDNAWRNRNASRNNQKEKIQVVLRMKPLQAAAHCRNEKIFEFWRIMTGGVQHKTLKTKHCMPHTYVHDHMGRRKKRSHGQPDKPRRVTCNHYIRNNSPLKNTPKEPSQPAFHDTP